MLTKGSEDITIESMRKYQDLISRREVLLKLATTGTIALALQPILSLAAATYVNKDTNEKYDKITIYTHKYDIWNEDLSSIFYAKISVEYGDKNDVVMALLVRDAPDMIIIPGILIRESNTEAMIVGIGSDTEYIIVNSDLKDDIESYIDKVIENAKKEKKFKVVRYANIVKNAYKKRKNKDKKDKDKELHRL